MLSVNVEAQTATVSSDTLYWSKGSKLIWEDFKGVPIDAPRLFGEIFCLLPANYKKDTKLAKIKYGVLAIVDKEASWVHPQRKTAKTLKYFQLHFDLFECYARKMRKSISETNFDNEPSEKFNDIYGIQMSLLTKALKQMKADQNWVIMIRKYSPGDLKLIMN